MRIQNETVVDKTVLANTKFLGEFVAYSYKDGLSASILSTAEAKSVEEASQKRLLKSNSCEYYQTSREQLPLQAQQVQVPEVPRLRHTQIEIGECIGEGSFSSVYTIKSIRKQQQPSQNTSQTTCSQKKLQASKCVIKLLKKDVVQKPSMLAACAADMAKEGYIMASLSHNHVLSVQAWTPTGISGLKSGRHDAFFLVLEKLQDTLGKRMKQWKKHSFKLKYMPVLNSPSRKLQKTNFLKERLQVALQLADAVAYLHRQQIMHRDLKPENIGFDGLGVLKVFDFDVSRIMPNSNTSDDDHDTDDHDRTFLFTKQIGSPRYMSPECARGEPYNLKSDVYTFALLVHELLSLEKPYEDIAACDHLYSVFMNGARPVVPRSWPQAIQTLLQTAWSDDIKTRPKMQQVYQILVKEIPLMVAEKQRSRQLNHRSWSLGTSSAAAAAPAVPQQPQIQ